MNHWRDIDRQVGEHRISFIQLSATAPLRDHCTEWYTTQVLRVVRRHFTPDSFHSLPLRRGSEASLHCRASSGLPTLSPLLLLYFQLSHTSNAGPSLIFHFVHFFLNKATIVCIFATFR